MRIATFNITTSNAAFRTCWLAASAPDVVYLQELKCAQANFPADAIHKARYHAV
jgi:exodeoxyribonuclease-3